MVLGIKLYLFVKMWQDKKWNGFALSHPVCDKVLLDVIQRLQY